MLPNVVNPCCPERGGLHTRGTGPDPTGRILGQGHQDTAGAMPLQPVMVRPIH